MDICDPYILYLGVLFLVRALGLLQLRSQRFEFLELSVAMVEELLEFADTVALLQQRIILVLHRPLQLGDLALELVDLTVA
jgi:hypothetical protein